MIVKIIFERGWYIIGKRKWWYQFDETGGTHHYFVLETNMDSDMVGKRIAVPIKSVLVFILNYRRKVSD